MPLLPSNCAAVNPARSSPRVLRPRVVVLGNGPAGIAAACVLAQAGVDTVLVGQESGHQLKAGESLPGAALRLLRRLGIASLESLLTPDAFLGCSATVSAWGEEHWTYKDALYNPEGGGWHLLRHRFDAMLLAHARTQGVPTLFGHCHSLTPRGSGHRLTVSTAPAGEDRLTVIEADFLIDATGRHCWAGRRLGARPVKLSQQLAAVGWLNGLHDDRDNSTRIKSVADGWWYSARLPQGLRVVAFHGLPRAVMALTRHPDAFRAACHASGVLPASLKAIPRPQKLNACDASVTLTPHAAGENWLAVGDAALSFDPLSSQGIFFALYSGIRGAEAALACLHQPAQAAQARADYHQQVMQVFAVNQQTRQLFYTRELRYRQHDYWQTQQRAVRIHR